MLVFGCSPGMFKPAYPFQSQGSPFPPLTQASQRFVPQAPRRGRLHHRSHEPAVGAPSGRQPVDQSLDGPAPAAASCREVRRAVRFDHVVDRRLILDGDRSTGPDRRLSSIPQRDRSAGSDCRSGSAGQGGHEVLVVVDHDRVDVHHRPPQHPAASTPVLDHQRPVQAHGDDRAQPADSRWRRCR